MSSPSIAQYLLPVLVTLPLGGAFLIQLLKKISILISDIIANFILGVLVVLVFSLLNSPVLVYKVGGWMPVKGIPIGIYLVLDGLSLLLLIIINMIGLISLIFSISYMRRFTNRPLYYTLFLLMIAGMNGVVMGGDLFNIYVFLEVAAIASYSLVAFGTEADELEASFKYQVMGTVASAFILLGIIIIYSITGTLNLADIGLVLKDEVTEAPIILTGVLFLVGFGLKGAMMPFHAWLPDAHPSAPAPISAMLSGVLIKAIGIYTLVRIMFNAIGVTPIFSNIMLCIAAISMTAGAFLAFAQWDFKRLLAYSSISQMGYVMLGIWLMTPLGILGGLFHMLNHSVFKSLLFLNSGAVVYGTGSRQLKKLGGLNQKMPVTSSTSLIASMSIAGIPPFNGFWSKLIIIMACIQSRHFFLAGLAIVVSVMTLVYYLKVQRYAFWGELQLTLKDIREVPFAMCFSMILLAFLCTIMGALLLPGVKELFIDPAVNALVNGREYISLVLK
jgi:multicomponent Na+:H+ antiporter subunit D